MHEYLDTLASQIRCKKARGMVEEEVRAHIQDQAEAFEAAGMPEEEARKEAVRQMGDPVEAGVALDQIHRPGMDWKMLLLVGVLSAAGLAVLYGSGAEQYGELLVWRQCLYTGIGFLVMLIVCWMDYSILGRFPVWLWLGFSAVIIGTVFFGPTVNGTNNYLRPVIYLYVPLYAGILYRYRGGGYSAIVKCFGFCLASVWISMYGITIPVCLDVAGICLVLTVLAVCRNWFRVSKKRTLGIAAGVTAVVPAVFFIWGMNGGFTTYQVSRIQAVLHPMSDSMGSGVGYSYRMLRTIRQAGRLMGQSSVVVDGQNHLAFELIPGSSYSDYILTHLISYYGILAGLAVLCLLAFFLIRIFRISVRQKNQLGMMIGVGCGMVFAVQVYHYVLSNLGFGIIPGINLPFFTYGKWITCSTFVLTGLLLSIYRYKDVSPDRKPGCERHYRIRIEKIEY